MTKISFMKSVEQFEVNVHLRFVRNQLQRWLRIFRKSRCYQMNFFSANTQRRLNLTKTTWNKLLSKYEKRKIKLQSRVESMGRVLSIVLMGKYLSSKFGIRQKKSHH